MGRAVKPVTALIAATALGLMVCSRAEAVICGQRPAKKKDVAQATLSLEPSSSFTESKFKRNTKPGPLSLVFKVEGCRLARHVSKPKLVVVPLSNPGLPKSAVSISDAVSKVTTLILVLQVDPNKFDPGSYKSLISANAPYLASNSTPVLVSRSDPGKGWPIGIAGAAGLAGVAWLAIGVLVALSGPAKIDFLWLGVAVVVGLILALLSLKASYFDKEVWTLSDNWWTTLTAAFAAGSTGAVTGLVGKGIHKRVKQRRASRRRTARQPSPRPARP